jgi:exopolysaccharide biosynthesis protein
MSKKKAAKKPWMIAVLSLLLILISLLISLVLFVAGPFNNLQAFWIGTAMSTMRHQYLATGLFSKDKIATVMQKQSPSSNIQQQDSLSGSSNTSNGVTMEEISASDGQYHGYLLTISNPLRVKLAVTKYIGTRGETTSQLAQDHDALTAVNAGGFSYSSQSLSSSFKSGDNMPNSFSNGSLPSDFVIVNGKIVWKDPNYSSTDTSSSVIALDTSGKLIVGHLSYSELLARRVQYAVTMPGYEPLIVNGKSTNSAPASDLARQPRTVIGQKADKTILLLVTEGRSFPMVGATIADITKIMLDHGAVTAANLDGGYSSTMVLNGKVVNKITADYGQRTVPTAFYVTK